MKLWELVRLVSERYGKRLEQHKRSQAAAAGFSQITVQQFQYLQAIRRTPQPTISYLKNYFGVRSPTATAIVNRLQERGFVKKGADASDGRKSRLLLTPRAEKILAAQEWAFKALGEDIKAALSPKDRVLYARVTEQVCAKLAEDDAGAETKEPR